MKILLLIFPVLGLWQLHDNHIKSHALSIPKKVVWEKVTLTSDKEQYSFEQLNDKKKTWIFSYDNTKIATQVDSKIMDHFFNQLKIVKKAYLVEKWQKENMQKQYEIYGLKENSTVIVNLQGRERNKTVYLQLIIGSRSPNGTDLYILYDDGIYRAALDHVFHLLSIK